MHGDTADLLSRAILVMVPMILSLTVHEFAHAQAGKWLGDDTAERMGRLTLNPVAHIDPIGTLLLPMLGIMFGGGGFFGWAKPVPFNPTRFRRSINMRTGAMLVASAGPISNLVLAVASVAFLAAAYHGGAVASVPEPFLVLAQQMLTTNVGLALFNMLPVHPLDGQKVLVGLLPREAALSFDRFSVQYGTMLLLGVLVVGGRLITVPFIFIIQGLLQLFGLHGAA